MYNIFLVNVLYILIQVVIVTELIKYAYKTMSKCNNMIIMILMGCFLIIFPISLLSYNIMHIWYEQITITYLCCIPFQIALICLPWFLCIIFLQGFGNMVRRMN
jgi:hypothetical protein